jgi:cell division FtsZ-interacting protein ZapD
MKKVKSNQQTAVRVLEQLENQLLNGIASEYKQDILNDIKEELHEVQQALKWARRVGKLKRQYWITSLRTRHLPP